MSKIAIKGATTGTGVFTLESPATNTDRTLILPDEAGTVLTSVTGGGVYAKDNILGTVSQSGGVPTGAIIERGSNANGEYVKYADGTLICTIRSRFFGASFLITSGNTFTWTFPSAFSNTNHLCVTVTNDTVSFNGLYVTTSVNLTVSSVGITNSGAASTYFSANAIGRWY